MEKNPTSSFKIGGILEKKSKTLMGNRHFFSRKKCSPIFMKIYRSEVQIEKICRILENLKKTFFFQKKIQLQVSKSAVFWKKKIKILMGSRHFFPQKTGSLIFIKIYRNEVQIEKICRILENLRKTFFYWKKVRLQLSKSGVLVVKKGSLNWLKFRS